MRGWYIITFHDMVFCPKGTKEIHIAKEIVFILWAFVPMVVDRLAADAGHRTGCAGRDIADAWSKMDAGQRDDAAGHAVDAGRSGCLGRHPGFLARSAYPERAQLSATPGGRRRYDGCFFNARIAEVWIYDGDSVIDIYP